ncbi:hypothetical protein TNCT_544671 [Trichonephila clavata]|uniref:Uncharacterized protein n=1 Tax=Trichonephila clavata TaxID=2740835 RepID=A0A8X6J9B7_TRICU|nr:hypothetical protein TNCT_544671 [Trichonephila clavata]
MTTIRDGRPTLMNGVNEKGAISDPIAEKIENHAFPHYLYKPIGFLSTDTRTCSPGSPRNAIQVVDLVQNRSVEHSASTSMIISH